MLYNVIHVYVTDTYGLTVSVSAWIWVMVALLIAWGLWHSLSGRKRLHVVNVNIQLGNIGAVQLKPNWEDIQIAHRMWTELVTRKAAIPIDPDNDVILEIYDSWYALFQRVRQLVSDIPGQCIRREQSTQKIVRIATDTLNLGLRPHLTRWQAEFRNWWEQSKSELTSKSPQQHQKEFPEYTALIADMRLVNSQLIQYSGELQKIAHGID